VPFRFPAGYGNRKLYQCEATPRKATGDRGPGREACAHTREELPHEPLAVRCQGAKHGGPV